MLFHDLVRNRLEGTGLNVDGYLNHRFLSGKPVDKAVIGQENSVFIVTHKSMKGLEADAVFVPRINRFDLESQSTRDEKMILYVMCSRARELLEFHFQGALKNSNRVIGYLRDLPQGVIQWQ